MGDTLIVKGRQSILFYDIRALPLPTLVIWPQNIQLENSVIQYGSGSGGVKGRHGIVCGPLNHLEIHKT